MYPFWSPDGRSVGFFADGKLKRLDVAGGIQTLAAASVPRGGTWGGEGTILFTPQGTGPMFLIPASGGTAKPALRLTATQASVRFPHFLPDDRHFSPT